MLVTIARCVAYAIGGIITLAGSLYGALFIVGIFAHRALVREVRRLVIPFVGNPDFLPLEYDEFEDSEWMEHALRWGLSEQFDIKARAEWTLTRHAPFEVLASVWGKDSEGYLLSPYGGRARGARKLMVFTHPGAASVGGAHPTPSSAA